MKRALGAAATLAMAAVVIAAAPKAGVSLSNRVAATKDARVLTATMTPKSGWVGPYRWRITVNDSLRWTATAQRVVDTTTLGFPVCVRYRATVFPFTPARDSLTRVLTLCRTGMPDEVAHLDSYPVQTIRANKPPRIGDSTSYVCKLLRNKYNGTVLYFDPKCRDLADDFYHERRP